MIYEDLLEFFLAWCRTRKWRRLLLAAAVLALLPLMVAGLVVYGAMLSRPDIYGRYLSLVQDDINESIDAASRSEEVDLDSSARVLQVPLRRILQLGNSNERVAFVVANSLAAQGRVGMAVQMMREIAPAGDSGFAPAHAWMANHELSLGVKTPAQAEKILHDLEIADSSGVTLSANQVMVFVNLLIANRREQEALKVL
ncbi:MAG: hypothetical protein KDA45_11035, partial [Planctomycetales bacterium]|nr:hypothetical protein [Planctomycetales bacterium]